MISPRLVAKIESEEPTLRLAVLIDADNIQVRGNGPRHLAMENGGCAVRTPLACSLGLRGESQRESEGLSDAWGLGKRECAR